MTKSSHAIIYALADAAAQQNTAQVFALLRKMEAAEPAQSTLKKRLESLLRHYAPDTHRVTLDASLESLVYYRPCLHTLEQVVMPAENHKAIEDLLAEWHHADKLAQYRLTPRNRLLLTGAPGTGKTVLAGAIADHLQVPCMIVNYGSLLSSYLGETGSRITRLLQALNGQPCVLFLDEMETVLSERSGSENRMDVGEQARIVSSLLLALDRLDASIFFIGATNHGHLLDSAVRRRFDLEIQMPLASESAFDQWIESLKARYPEVPWENRSFFINALDNHSWSDLERDFLDQARKWVIKQEAATNPTHGASEV